VEFLGVIILVVAGFFLTKSAINWIKQKEGKHIRLRVLLCVLSYCLFIILSGKLFVFMIDFSIPSKVDISPLAQLTTYQMYNLNEQKKRIATLEYIEGIEKFDSHEWGDDIGREWVFYYEMYNWDIPASSSVYFWIYDNSENAKRKFEWEKNHRQEKRRIVKISKDIDAMLCNSVMYRNLDTFLAYNSQRDLYTYVRIGNVVLSFSEGSDIPREIGALTSKNIELICQVLIE
jgi:hypothetical protein